MSAHRLSVVRAVACRFRADHKASAAVEFAFIAPLFFLLLFAIIDVALIFFAGQTLETATQLSARLILTGQAQSGSYTQAQFKQDFCSNTVPLINCQNGVTLDVESYTSFSAISDTNPITNCQFTPPNNYNLGSAGSIVVVHAFYQWPIFVPTLGFNPSNLCSNVYMLESTAAFRNEPYGSN